MAQLALEEDAPISDSSDDEDDDNSNDQSDNQNDNYNSDSGGSSEISSEMSSAGSNDAFVDSYKNVLKNGEEVQPGDASTSADIKVGDDRDEDGKDKKKEELEGAF